MADTSKHHLSLIEIISLGIGTMIGAGIFALFGSISDLAGGYAWLAFAASAIISASAGYGYAVLARSASTNGGIAEYLDIGWQGGLTGRTIAFCYYLSIAVVLGLVAKSFGHYTTKVLSLGDGAVLWLGIAVMLLFLLVNALGLRLLGLSEKLMVGAKLLVLVGFTIVAFTQFDFATYAQNSGSVAFNAGDFVNAVALANLSFAGFAVIANAGGSVKEGAGTIGRAIFIAIALVAVIYISLDIAVFGSIDLSRIEKAKDYALAEAATPILGQAGFLLLGITAMVSTATNINANIFSGSNTISYMAKERELSPILSRQIFLRQGNIAMIATVVIVIVMLISMNLEQIGDVASLTFLLVHTFVPMGAALHVARGQGRGNATLLWLAAILNAGVMVFFAYHLIGDNTLELYVFAGLVAFSLVFCTISKAVIDRQGAGDHH